MKKNAPAAGATGGAKRVLVDIEANTDSTDSAPSRQELAAFRARLVAARARLVERVILEYDPDKTYPSPAWTRMVADIHATIGAVDDMMATAISTIPNRRTKT